jgi:hypothetical protein
VTLDLVRQGHQKPAFALLRRFEHRQLPRIATCCSIASPTN